MRKLGAHEQAVRLKSADRGAVAMENLRINKIILSLVIGQIKGFVLVVLVCAAVASLFVIAAMTPSTTP
jgi:hypothetical protein